MTPLELYQQQLTENKIESNASQEDVIVLLTDIYNQLTQQNKKSHTLLTRLANKFEAPKHIKGLYLWGSVGSGKTYLVNLFYQTLSIPKMRQHFHVFMQHIQEQLTLYQGTKNPLNFIAKKIAAETHVLVLDEFFVNDIADAIILSELLSALFQEGICLVTTSNTEPDQLYLNGLQREYFLPAIDLIKEYTQVIKMKINQDYRLRYFPGVCAYYHPLNEDTQFLFESCFLNLIPKGIPQYSKKEIILFERVIKVEKEAGGVIWFNFTDICGHLRAAKDYIELANRYQIFMISNVPDLTTATIDQLILFIYLVDILYDEHLQLILSAAVPLSELYPHGRLRSRFERTESRLLEMQSPLYFHKPK